MTWVRFERGIRYHAVYREAGGGFWTYCARFIRATGVTDQAGEPPARCACCRSRLKLPYLVPAKLRELPPAGERTAHVA